MSVEVGFATHLAGVEDLGLSIDHMPTALTKCALSFRPINWLKERDFVRNSKKAARPPTSKAKSNGSGGWAQRL